MSSPADGGGAAGPGGSGIFAAAPAARTGGSTFERLEAVQEQPQPAPAQVPVPAPQPEQAAEPQAAAEVVAPLEVPAGQLPYPGDDAPKPQIAAWMASRAQAAGIPPELPVMAALVESRLSNINYGHADSIGFFQMRTSIWDQGEYAGYGKDPEKQIKWFIDHAVHEKEKRVADGYTNFLTDPSKWGEWVADVERPAEEYRGRYQERLAEAQALLKESGGAAPAATPEAAVEEAHEGDAHAGHGHGPALAETPGPALTPSAELEALLASPNLDAPEAARADLASGKVDPRLVSMLTQLTKEHKVGLSVIITGHDQFTSGGSVSNHFVGRGIDIAAVDGEIVRPNSIASRELAEAIADLPESIRPSEVGTPWNIGAPGFFTDGAHQDHLHIAYDDPAPAGFASPVTPAAAPAAAAVPAAPAVAAPEVAEAPAPRVSGIFAGVAEPEAAAQTVGALPAVEQPAQASPAAAVVEQAAAPVVAAGSGPFAPVAAEDMANTNEGGKLHASEFHVADAEGAPGAEGNLHAGYDLFARAGAPVRSPIEGTVVEVKASRGNTGQIFGGTVKVQGADGRVWVFRHVDPTGVVEGGKVTAGQEIASVTEWTGGAHHAHIELWKTLKGGYRVENMEDPYVELQKAYAGGGAELPPDPHAGEGEEGHEGHDHGGGGELAEAGPAASPSAELEALLANPRLELPDAARADLGSGRVDPRMVSMLTQLTKEHSVRLSVIITGHDQFTSGGSVSNHFVGRGIDIATVDGQPVNVANAAAREVATELAALTGDVRPTEIGTPWAISASGFFTDGAHQDHLHVAFDDPPPAGFQAPAAAAPAAPAVAAAAPAAPGAPVAAAAAAPPVAKPGESGQFLAAAAQTADAAGAKKGVSGMFMAPQPPAGPASAVANPAAVPGMVDAAAAAAPGGGSSSLGVAALKVAQTQLGVHEAGTNTGKEVDEYLAAAKVGPGNPWCASFVTWALEKAGHKMDGTGWAAVQTWVRNAEAGNNDLKVISAEEARPGDIVTYDWGHDSDFGADGHIGFLASDVQGGKFTALEGNNQDQVMKVPRSVDQANVKFLRIGGDAPAAPAVPVAPATPDGAGLADAVSAAAGSGGANPYPGDNASKAQLANWLGREAEKRGLPKQLPVMASLVESGVKNLNYGDADSVGFFQMRVGIWNQGAYKGFPEKPELQAKWFLDTAEQVKKQRIARGQSVTDPKQFGEWIADIERPAAQYRGRYQLRLDEARRLLR